MGWFSAAKKTDSNPQAHGVDITIGYDIDVVASFSDHPNTKIISQALQEMIIQSTHSGITRDDIFYFMGTTNEGSFGIRGERAKAKPRYDLVKSKLEEMAVMPFEEVEKLADAFEAGTEVANAHKNELAVAKAHKEAQAFIEKHIKPWADKNALFEGRDEKTLLKELEGTIAAEHLKPAPSFAEMMGAVFR